MNQFAPFALSLKLATRTAGRRLRATAGLLVLTALAPVAAATLEDFGYLNMTVNGQAALGGRPTLVLLLDLAATGTFFHANAEYDNLVFNPFHIDAGTGNPRSVNGFMLVNSDGRFHLTRAGTGLMGPLTLSDDERSKALTNDVMRAGFAITAAHRAGFDFAPYDEDQDGTITANEVLFLIFDNLNQMDSGAARWANPAGTGGAFKPEGSAVSFSLQVALLTQRVSFATLCHEFSHLLGTKDLYGIWNVTCHNNAYTVMSCTITFADDRASCHLDAWHKLQLGWLEPRIRSILAGGVETVPATQSQATDAPVILYDPARGFNEYFLVEYRTSTSPWGAGYEDNLPSNGLGIWHVVHDGSRNLQEWVNVGQSVWLEGQPNLERGQDANLLWTSGTVTPALRWSDGTTSGTTIFVQPFNPGDGSITFEWLHPGERWVDFAYGGFEAGTFANPFNTLAEGLQAVPHGGILNFKPGSSRETATISKRMTLRASSGPVTLGAP
jgi:M6 family metalloprotease-like protein